MIWQDVLKQMILYVLVLVLEIAISLMSCGPFCWEIYSQTEMFLAPRLFTVSRSFQTQL